LIEPWKGFHYLVEAFGAVKMRDSELVLWGGPGSRAVNQYLREQMARNPAVKVRTDMNQVGYGAVYAKSNVLVLPSLSDGFGFVVAEAMASGVPVIVTPNTGAADLVVDGKNGFIVPTRDRDAISDRLLYLAQNPAVLRQMGRAARATAQTLTFERFRRHYIPLLESLVSGGRGMSHD
jgi:glycosyltransferase involved in cell wall biosynthesis